MTYFLCAIKFSSQFGKRTDACRVICIVYFTLKKKKKKNKDNWGDFYIYKDVIILCVVSMNIETIKDTSSLVFWIFQISAQASFLVLFS